MGTIVQYILQLKDEATKTLEKTGDAAEKTDQQTGGLTETMVKLGPTMAAAATAIAATAGAMFKYADAASQFVDDTINMSRTVGLATETIIGLEAAASAGGSSFSKLRTGLVTFVGVIGDVNEGSSEAADKFARLEAASGAVIDTTGDMDTVLRSTLDAIGALPDDTARAAAAVDIFGSKGAQLVAVLGQSSESLDKWTQKAKEMGVAIDQDAVKASIAMDDALTEMDLSMKGLTQELGQAFTPSVVESVEALTSLVSIGVKVIGPLEKLGSVIKKLNPALAALGAVSTFFEELQVRGEGAATAAQSVRDAMSGAGAAAEQTGRVYADLTNGVSDLDRVFAGLDDTLGKVAKTTKEAQPFVEDLFGDLLDLADAAAVGKGGADDLEIALAEAELGLKDGSLSSQQYSDALDAIGEAWDRVAARTEEGSDKIVVAADDIVVATSRMSAASGISAGFAGLTDPTAILGLAGPGGAAAGAALSGLQSIGGLGAEGVEEELAGFREDVVAGIEALPEILAEVIPDFMAAFVAEVVPAIAEAIATLLTGGAGPFDVEEGQLDLGKRLGNLGISALDAVTFGSASAIASHFDSKASGGFQNRTRPTILHRGEVVTSAAGSFSQGARRNMAASGGGGGVTVNVTNNGVMESDAMDALARKLNEAMGDFGRGSSPLFGQV